MTNLDSILKRRDITLATLGGRVGSGVCAGNPGGPGLWLWAVSEGRSCGPGAPLLPQVLGLGTGKQNLAHPSWVALHDMAHSFIQLHKAVIHVIILISFL